MNERVEMIESGGPLEVPCLAKVIRYWNKKIITFLALSRDTSLVLYLHKIIE